MLSYQGEKLNSKIYNAIFPNWVKACDTAYEWLKSTNSDIKILFEQNRNLGDTLHLLPIIKHYRKVYPNAKMALLVGQPYLNAHEFNNDIDAIFGVPILNPQERIALRRHILTYAGLTHIIAPSIFPYGEVWKELKWSYPNIADQYFINAGIQGEPLGGRKLTVEITPEDQIWAENFFNRNKLERRKSCAIEYNSYSNQPAWGESQFNRFINRLLEYDVKCISFAGSHESPLKNTISATGTTWRQTVALMNLIGNFVGIGSGLTMLACSTQVQPNMLEIALESSISASGCRYANTIVITNLDPTIVADHLWFKVINQ